MNIPHTTHYPTHHLKSLHSGLSKVEHLYRVAQYILTIGAYSRLLIGANWCIAASAHNNQRDSMLQTNYNLKNVSKKEAGNQGYQATVIIKLNC